MNTTNNMEKIMTDGIMDLVRQLEDRVRVLEEENISLTNELYRLENSLDARIDILSEHLGVNYVRTPDNV
jgi:hypothetical protein